MAVNAAVVLAEKLCYWVKESYPTHSDQIFLTLLKRKMVPDGEKCLLNNRNTYANMVACE